MPAAPVSPTVPHASSVTAPARTARTFGGTAYPLVLPNIRDPRLHVAAVIITIHVLGQVGLHFRVSVPQILAAILTCAVIEVALTFPDPDVRLAGQRDAHRQRRGADPAGRRDAAGRPLEHGGWWVSRASPACRCSTKYVIKYRGSHVFNPSNIGLVVAFIVLGSSRVEPLDFWWGAARALAWSLAYAVILGGGLLITRRLQAAGAGGDVLARARGRASGCSRRPATA